MKQTTATNLPTTEAECRKMRLPVAYEYVPCADLPSRLARVYQWALECRRTHAQQSQEHR